MSERRDKEKDMTNRRKKERLEKDVSRRIVITDEERRRLEEWGRNVPDEKPVEHSQAEPLSETDQDQVFKPDPPKKKPHQSKEKERIKYVYVDRELGLIDIGKRIAVGAGLLVSGVVIGAISEMAKKPKKH